VGQTWRGRREEEEEEEEEEVVMGEGWGGRIPHSKATDQGIHQMQLVPLA